MREAPAAPVAAAVAVAVALAMLALTDAAVAQTTWIVDDTPGTGVHFTSLPAAVAAAANGDTLLVGPGLYAPFHVSGKALTIVGAGSAATVIDRPPPAAGPDYVAIDAVPLGTVFRLSGVRVRRDLGTQQERLVLRGSGVATSGAVVLDHVASGPPVFVFPAFPLSPSEAAGLHVRGLLVHAHHCDFTGGTRSTGFFSGYLIGFPGVLVDSAAAFVADACVLRGGYGAALFTTAYTGEAGLRAIDAECRLTNCSSEGGSFGGGTYAGGRSGHGVDASGTATVRIVGAASDRVRGGAMQTTGGIGGNGIVSAPPAVVTVHGPVAVSGGEGRYLNGVAVAGASITIGLPPLPRLRFDGTASPNGSLLATQPVTLAVDRGPGGEVVVLLADALPGAAPLPGLAAEPLLLGPTCAIVASGWLDGAGAFALTTVPATQLPYLVGLPTHWQAFVWAPAVGRWLGSNAELLRLQL